MTRIDDRALRSYLEALQNRLRSHHRPAEAPASPSLAAGDPARQEGRRPLSLGTPASAIEYVIDLIDLVLVMSVNPGFGGQAFIKSALGKISDIRAMTAGRPVDIGSTVAWPLKSRDSWAAGANALVAARSLQGRHAKPQGQHFRHPQRGGARAAKRSRFPVPACAQRSSVLAIRTFRSPTEAPGDSLQPATRWGRFSPIQDRKLIGHIYSAPYAFEPRLALSSKMTTALRGSPSVRWTPGNGRRGWRLNGGQNFADNTPILLRGRRPNGPRTSAALTLSITRNVPLNKLSSSIQRIYI